MQLEQALFDLLEQQDLALVFVHECEPPPLLRMQTGRRRGTVTTARPRSRAAQAQALAQAQAQGATHCSVPHLQTVHRLPELAPGQHDPRDHGEERGEDAHDPGNHDRLELAKLVLHAGGPALVCEAAAVCADLAASCCNLAPTNWVPRTCPQTTPRTAIR